MRIGSLRTIRPATFVAPALAVVAGVAAVHVERARSSENVLLSELPVESAAEGETGGARIALLFQMEDCARMGAALRLWDRAAEPAGLLEGSVEGFLLGGTVADAADLPVRLGVDFPVRSVSSRRLARGIRALGFRRTPLLLAFDAEGRLRLAAPLLSSPGPAELAAVLDVPAPPAGGEG